MVQVSELGECVDIAHGTGNGHGVPANTLRIHLCAPGMAHAPDDARAQPRARGNADVPTSTRPGPPFRNVGSASQDVMLRKVVTDWRKERKP